MATVTYGFGKKNAIMSFFSNERTYESNDSLFMTSGACFDSFYPERVKKTELQECPVYFIINCNKDVLEVLIDFLNKNTKDFKIIILDSNDISCLVSIDVNNSDNRMVRIILEYMLLIILRIIERTEWYGYDHAIEKMFDPKNPMDSIVKLSSEFNNTNHSIFESKKEHEKLYNGNLLKCLSLKFIESIKTIICMPRGYSRGEDYTFDQMYREFLIGRWDSTYYIGQSRIFKRLLSKINET